MGIRTKKMYRFKSSTHGQIFPEERDIFYQTPSPDPVAAQEQISHDEHLSSAKLTSPSTPCHPRQELDDVAGIATPNETGIS